MINFPPLSPWRCRRAMRSSSTTPGSTSTETRIIFYVEELAASISRRLMRTAPLLRRKREVGHRHAYWANHCEHCGLMLSDEALHCEPGGFMPTQPDEAAAIQLTRVVEAFSAEAAGYALEPELFSLIRRL